MEEESTGALPTAEGSEAADLDMAGLDAILEADDDTPDAPDDAGSQPVAEGQQTENSASDTATADAEQPEDTTPEPDDPNESPKLKEIRAKLSRSEWRAAAEHFESKTAAQLQAANDAAEAARAAEATREAAAATVREQQGKFIGALPIQLPDGQGGFKAGPTYDELVQLSLTARGRDALFEKYGLDEPSAEYLKTELDQRREMLDGAAGHFREDAWMEMGKMLAAAVASEGLPLAQVWQGVNNAQDVVVNVVKTLRAEHAAAMAKQKTEYEGRLNAKAANGTAASAQAASKRLPTPETGGRGDSSGARTYTMSEINAMSPSQFRQMEAELDRAEAEGRILVD